MEVEQGPSGRTSAADAFDNDNAATVATVALDAALEPADPLVPHPLGLLAHPLRQLLMPLAQL